MRFLRFSAKPKRLKPIILRRVAGQSMAPTLDEGELIFARTFFKDVKPHDIVVVKHNGLEKIKRVQKVRSNEIFIVGDNPTQSTDSRDFGWIHKERVIAKLLT